MAHKKLSLAAKYAVSFLLVLMVFLPLLVTIVSSLKIPGSWMLSLHYGFQPRI